MNLIKAEWNFDNNQDVNTSNIVIKEDKNLINPFEVMDNKVLDAHNKTRKYSSTNKSSSS